MAFPFQPCPVLCGSWLGPAFAWNICLLCCCHPSFSIFSSPECVALAVKGQQPQELRRQSLCELRHQAASPGSLSAPVGSLGSSAVYGDALMPDNLINVVCGLVFLLSAVCSSMKFGVFCYSTCRKLIPTDTGKHRSVPQDAPSNHELQVLTGVLLLLS